MTSLDFLKTYHGKTIVELFRTDYKFNDQENEDNFGSLQITFNDNSVLVFDENGDAESISISERPIHFGGNLGDWQKIILNNVPDWSRLVSSKLTNSSLLENTYGDRTWICGCRLFFENQKSFTYFNYYDDAKVAFGDNEKLKSFIEYENLNWIS